MKVLLVGKPNRNNKMKLYKKINTVSLRNHPSRTNK